jgi:hypothetical protein
MMVTLKALRRVVGLTLSAAAIACLLRSAQAAESGKIPLDIKLPLRAFTGTPRDVPTNSYTEPFDSEKKRPLMLVPAGLKNIAKDARLSSSDKNATVDSLAKLVDGDKEATEQSTIYLRKGSQWVQLDFGSAQEIFAAVIWHAHNSLKVYHDVIVQVANDPDFTAKVQTVYNNDQDNSSGLGVGTDREYFEEYQGRLIPIKGAKSRYMRCYSKGSTESPLNEYTEIEVYGRPAE